jgi:hypothetical protein
MPGHGVVDRIDKVNRKGMQFQASVAAACSSQVRDAAQFAGEWRLLSVPWPFHVHAFGINNRPAVPDFLDSGHTTCGAGEATARRPDSEVKKHHLSNCRSFPRMSVHTIGRHGQRWRNGLFLH